MEPSEGVDKEAWAPSEPGLLGLGEGAEPGIGEVRASSLGGRGGDGEGYRGNEGWGQDFTYPRLGIITNS